MKTKIIKNEMNLISRIVAKPYLQIPFFQVRRQDGMIWKFVWPKGRIRNRE